MKRVKKDLDELDDIVQDTILENSEIGLKETKKVKIKKNLFPEPVTIVTKNRFFDSIKDMYFEIEFGDEGTMLVRDPDPFIYVYHYHINGEYEKTVISFPEYFLNCSFTS